MSKKEKKVARPFTKDESTVLKKEFLDAYLANKGFTLSACKTINIPYPTFFYWLTNDPEFKQAVKAIDGTALEMRKDVAEQELQWRIVNIRDRDTPLLFFLKTKCKDRGYNENANYISKELAVSYTKLKTISGLADAIAKVTEDMLSGKITTDEATKILSVLETNRKFIETVEFEQRLSKLEGKE